MTDYIYDIETYPNVFTLAIKEAGPHGTVIYEISSRQDDRRELMVYLDCIRRSQGRMVGFNNIAFDYPVLHRLIMTNASVAELYFFATEVIKSKDKFRYIIWEPYIYQVDLLKIHHFDNPAKFTGLKVLEFNMRSKNIQDLPFPPGNLLTDDQINVLRKYNINDVIETEKFYIISKDWLDLRKNLSTKYGKDFTNHSDVKIGTTIFVNKLETAVPGTCYVDRKPRQTLRKEIPLRDILLDFEFDSIEFKKIYEFLKTQTIVNTKGFFKNLICRIQGLDLKFGTGGLHGSVDSRIFKTNEHQVIIDLDVTSFYPSIAIVNNLFPEHLGSLFCTIYQQIKEERLRYGKGTPENQALKLSLNGTFGNTNNKYSPFYDPQYTMAITINGQLLLCKLIDLLLDSDIELIQTNTDGITVSCPYRELDRMQIMCASWQQITGLTLEENRYNGIFIRDVNNYLAESENGKVKKKGAYEYELPWYRNHSALVIPKVVEKVLLHGADPWEEITQHEDDFDFMCRTKIPRSSRLFIGDRQVQNVSRYYVSTNGKSMCKVMPPLKKKPNHYRKIGIHVGQTVTECNNVADFDRSTVNYGYYVDEINKLCDLKE